jgi:hypothetical protein
MGAGAAVLVPLITAVASAGLEYVNTRNVAKEQDRTAAAGIRARTARQHEIDAKTGKLISDIGASNPEQDIQNKLGEYKKVLMANKGNANAGVGTVANASSEYNTSADNARMGIGDYGNNVADIMSRIDAPQAQRTREGVMTSDYGVDTDLIKRASSGEDFLNSLKMQAIHRNPLMDAFAAVIGAYGKAKAGSSGGVLGAASGNPYGGTGGVGIPGLPPGP